MFDTYVNGLFKNISINNLLDCYTLVPEEQVFQQSDNGRVIDHEYLDSILATTDKKVLLCLDGNIQSNNTYQQCANMHPRIKVLSANLYDLFADNNLAYFPHWYAVELGLPNHQTTAKQFRFSYLSRNPRPHRLYLYQQIKSYITDQDCVAVHSANIANYRPLGVFRDKQLNDDLPYYSASAYDHWKEVFEQDVIIGGDIENQHNAYRAFINITGETDDRSDYVFVTEKTWKSIKSYCMFLTYGNPGTGKLLERLGFWTGPDIDTDCLHKADWIAELMRDWDFNFCEQLYVANIDKINYNNNRMYSNELKKLFADQLRLKLEL